MAWLAVDRDGSEQIYGYLPEKDGDDVQALPEIKGESWCFTYSYVLLPEGTIKRLIGRELGVPHQTYTRTPRPYRQLQRWASLAV